MLISLIAHVLSRDVDPNNKKNKEEFGIITEGIEDPICEELVQCVSLSQSYKTLNNFYERKFPQNYYSESLSHKTQCFIKKKLKTLILPGLSTKPFDNKREILDNIFNGVFTISIKPLTAHGWQNSLPLISFIHDLYHYEMVKQGLIVSLEQWIIHILEEKINKGPENKAIIIPVINEAIAQFYFLMNNLSQLNQNLSEEESGALFIFLHEHINGNMQASDWAYASNLPYLIQIWMKRYQDSLNSSITSNWMSYVDSYRTDPVTGALLPHSDFQKKKILEDFRKSLKEMQKLHFFEAHLAAYMNFRYQNTIYVANLIQCIMQTRHEIEMTNIELVEVLDQEGHLRFIDAIVSHKTGLECERIYFICTTLKHKLRNAKDYWLLLGKPADLSDPYIIKERYEALIWLKTLYQKKVPEASGMLLSKAINLFCPVDKDIKQKK